MMLDEAFVEAILTWKAEGPAPHVTAWLADRGLRALPMRAGLLVTGSLQRFEGAFGLALGHAVLPVALPVPPEFADSVSSITIPRPRTIVGSRHGRVTS